MNIADIPNAGGNWTHGDGLQRLTRPFVGHGARSTLTGLALLQVAILFCSGLAFAETTTLRFGIRNDVSTPNPFVNTAAQDHDIRTLLYEPLLLEDRDSRIRPYLAEAWTISNDGLVYVFTLRKGVKFHHGKEFSADDVQWSISYGQNPKNRAYGGAELKTIGSLDVLEPHKIRITLREPMASFLSLMTTLQTLPILPQDSLEAAEKPAGFPPGTGPYRFEHWRPGREIVLVRSPDYWQKGIPKIQRIELVIVTDPEVRFLALRTGELDLIEKMAPQYVPKIEKGEIPGLRIAVAEGSGIQGLVFNTRKPPFDQVKMRQMVASALDPEEILNGAYWGVGQVITQKMFPGSPSYFPLPARKRDLTRARRLLKEAGYEPGARIRLSGGVQAEKELAVIQSQLREAGVDVEIQLRDPPSHRVSLRNGDFEFATTGANAFLDPDQNYFDYFHTGAGMAGRGRNTSRYSNQKADRLLEEGRRTLDRQKRYELYRKFVELIYHEAPVIYYLISPNVFAYRPRLKGFETRGQGRFFSGDMGIPFASMER